MTDLASPWNALLRGPKPATFTSQLDEPRPDSKAGQVRRLLRERGAMTALQICQEVDIKSTALVMPVLKHDLAIGRIRRIGGRYELVDEFDKNLRDEITRAVALLKRNDYEVRKRAPKPQPY